jgi:hypothetical protein
MDHEWTDKRMDDFADRVDRFEANVDRRFDKVDERFDRFEAEVDRCFDKVDARFERVEGRFDSLQRTVYGSTTAIIAVLVAQILFR